MAGTEGWPGTTAPSAPSSLWPGSGAGLLQVGQESTDPRLEASDSSLGPAVTYVILGELTSPHLAGPPVLTGTVKTARYLGPWPVPILNLDSARLSRKDPHTCSPRVCPSGGGPPASGTLSQGPQAPVGVEGLAFR